MKVTIVTQTDNGFVDRVVDRDTIEQDSGVWFINIGKVIDNGKIYAVYSDSPETALETCITYMRDSGLLDNTKEKKMETTILRYEANWADEMDIYGLVFVTPEEADNIQAALPLYEESFTVYVGINEEIDYRNGSKLLRDITRVDLTEDEAKAVAKALGNTSWWGQFPDKVWDIIEELKENK